MSSYRYAKVAAHGERVEYGCGTVRVPPNSAIPVVDADGPGLSTIVHSRDVAPRQLPGMTTIVRPVRCFAAGGNPMERLDRLDAATFREKTEDVCAAVDHVTREMTA